LAPTRAGGSGQAVAVAPSRITTSGQAVTVAPSRARSAGQTVTIAPTRVGGAVTIQQAPARASSVGRARGADVHVDGTVVSVGGQEPSTVTVTSADGQASTVSVAGRGSQVTTVTTSEYGEAIRGQARSGGSATTVGRDNEGYGYATGDVPGRIAAIRQMARNAPPEAAAQGIGRLAFGDEDARVQRAAVDELERLGTRTAKDQLRRISRDHPSREIRARAADALR
jgi:hypothetical protein